MNLIFLDYFKVNSTKNSFGVVALIGVYMSIIYTAYIFGVFLTACM